MSRILVYTTPARGHLFPATPIMDELHSRGHNIALRTLGSQVPMMRKRGLMPRRSIPGSKRLPSTITSAVRRLMHRNARCGCSANAPGSTRSPAEWRLPRPGRGLPRAVFDLTVSATQYAKLSGEPKVPNASLRHSRRQEVRRRQRTRSKTLDKALRSRAAQGEREVFAGRDDQDAPHRLDRQ
jgi:hypothetical protein